MLMMMIVEVFLWVSITETVKYSLELAHAINDHLYLAEHASLSGVDA